MKLQGTKTKHADLFTDLDGKHHAARAKLLHEIYIMTSVLESESRIDRCTSLFMRRLTEFADQGVSF